MPLKQSKSLSKSSLPVLDTDTHQILIPACALTCGQALHFKDILSKLIQNCNVAKFSPTFQVETLWDSLTHPNCQTIDVDSKILTDLQRLAKIGDNLESSVLELIQYYESEKDLNIILYPDVLEKRTSYTNFTAQFAHALSRSQTFYPHIKVLFDPTTSRLGIFCRKSKSSSQGFVGSLVKQLLKHRAITMDNEELPKTYKTNFSMLKQHLVKNLPDSDRVFAITQLPDSILIELKNDKK